MNRKQKFRYMRDYIGDNKIKDSHMKRGIYASVFDMPKKLKKALKGAKNENHKNYMIKTFLSISIKRNSLKNIEYLKTI